MKYTDNYLTDTNGVRWVRHSYASNYVVRLDEANKELEAKDKDITRLTEYSQDRDQLIGKINKVSREKDKVITELKSALLRIQKQCELDGHITKGVISGICYKALGNGEQSDLLTTTDKG